MSKRADNKAATRQKAIEAAQKVWAKPGSYDLHGIREIASVMGMSTGAVFANFESKEALFCSAFPGQPAPIDSVLTRMAPKMISLLMKLGDADREQHLLSALDPEIAYELHYLLGNASVDTPALQAA